MTARAAATFCSAQSKQQNRQCHNRVTPPTRLCRFHGGAAPAIRNKAAKERVEIQARKLLPPREQWEPVSNVLEELNAIATEAKMWLTVLRGMVEQEKSVGIRHGRQGEQQRATVTAYTDALDQMFRICRDVARLDIDDRLATVTESQQRDMAAGTLTILFAVARQLGIDIQAPHVKTLVTTELRALPLHPEYPALTG